MLYLEDYLEMIEHLPQELRDRFTEMRELDLTVQNSMDSLEKKARTFFLQCKRGELQSNAAEIEFQNLRKEYYKVLEDADEKVAIATQIHDLVERYLRRLDSELFKFKCELEADNNGITEILEKRSLELDGSSSISSSNIGNQKENRYFGSIATNNHTGSSTASLPKDNRFRPKPEKRRDSTPAPVVEKRPNLGNSISTPAAPVAPVVQAVTPNVTHHAVIPPAAAGPSVSYNLQHMGGAGNAIAAAASQAIVATQQMQQGRRTASLKASYEAIHGAAGGATPHEFWINRDINTPSGQNTTLQTVDRESSARKHKKKSSSHLPQHTPATPTSIPSSSSSISSHAESSTSSIAEVVPTPAAVSAAATTSAAAAAAVQRNSTPAAENNSLVVEQTAEGEWSYDPNEPRYCICNQVSYGDMVACDNDACPFEWFHYPCVGITQPPKGKWYCPKCTASMRRRGNRKN
ncbi:inhibitor of growth protein 3 [Episyrphus balteatus]|uniref:inhibitor of growth protein 3 n=1 Tax=Episyrphus balteatus TaxID=286459 RepID=UPI002486C3D4|nr:inhibitor of growth protein 3 [Episyrphus balteatus]